MRAMPINDLNKCSVRGCQGTVTVIVQKTIGFQVIAFGYCQFHDIVANNYFPNSKDKVQIRMV